MSYLVQIIYNSQHKAVSKQKIDIKTYKVSRLDSASAAVIFKAWRKNSMRFNFFL